MSVYGGGAKLPHVAKEAEDAINRSRCPVTGVIKAPPPKCLQPPVRVVRV